MASQTEALLCIEKLHKTVLHEKTIEVEKVFTLAPYQYFNMLAYSRWFTFKSGILLMCTFISFN